MREINSSPSQIERCTLLLALLVMSVFGGCSDTGVSQSDYDALQYQYTTLMQQSIDLSTEIESMRAEYSDITGQLKNAQGQLAESRTKNLTLQADLDSVKAERENGSVQLDKLEQELQDALNDVAALEEQLALYKSSGISVYSEVQPPYSKSQMAFIVHPNDPESMTETKAAINLRNNPAAVDPSWPQLKQFVAADDTDEGSYWAYHECGDFAEEVHNNAEAAGIKAALVVLHFQEGEPHALNAFHTTDEGLVYIDCTGQDPLVATYYWTPSGGIETAERDPSSDKVAYVMVGKEYGAMTLDAIAPPSYEGYEEQLLANESYEERLRAYNSDVLAFNAEVQGKTYYIGTSEHTLITQWEDRLDQERQAFQELRNGLGSFWEPLGTVVSVEIYW